MSHQGIIRQNLAAAAERIRAAKSVVVFTGAGISAESGVPTYRSGADGLWSRQNMERFANPPGYAANLPASYDWYRARVAGVAGVVPHAGHEAIVRLETLVPSLTVITQNIDSLHQRAGSHDVIELHGSLRYFRCERCGEEVDSQAAPETAVCASCGGMLRPGVVMFGENLPESALARARDLAGRCDVLLSIGTSNQVWPAAELPLVTLSAGGAVIIVNPDLHDQPLGQRVIGLPLAAGEALPAIVAHLRPPE